jgi:hypothetical protein
VTTQTEIPTLASLEFVPYLTENGEIQEQLQKKIGIYSIFNQNKELQFVGYSRDIYLSLKQHLVRQPQSCYWLKLHTIDRPSRTILEETKQAWISENSVTPLGNSEAATIWTQPIDAKITMTAEEKAQYEASDELQQIKILKKVARKVQADIEEQLKQRHVNLNIRFNPKLKEQGLLDLKSD